MNKPNCCDKCFIPETLTWCKNPSCECHIQKANNMEPEKKCCLCHRERGTVPVNCECACHVPEKKDVWEEFHRGFPYNRLDWEQGEFLKSFIKTHFIPRAEVVEKTKEEMKNTTNFGGRTALRNLLDLLTQ